MAKLIAYPALLSTFYPEFRIMSSKFALSEAYILNGSFT